MAPLAIIMASVSRDEDKMKLLNSKRTVFLALLPLTFACGQVPEGTSFAWKHRAGISQPGPVTADDLKFEMIQNMIKTDGPLTVGFIQLHRMGDEAAVIVLKVLGSLPSPGKFSDAQKRKVLEIVNRAFEQPDSITNRSNVKPYATNLLLNLLKYDTEDVEIKTEISRLRSFAANAASQRFDR